MLEFVVLLVLLFDYENKVVGAQAFPVSSFEKCYAAAEEIKDVVTMEQPGLEVRTLCLPSEAARPKEKGK